MKRMLTIVLLLCLLTMLPVTTSAVQEDMSFAFELTVDGKDSKRVEYDDVITVVLKLKREDAAESFPMYAMQDEIRYDSQFFELVEESVILNQGVVTTDIAMVDRYRELYMNYLSMGGGTQWGADTMVGSFQLRVIGTHGTTHITNQDYLVSSQDGTYSYNCRAQDLTIILSSDCVVIFETNGGVEIPDAVVEYGTLLTAPAVTEREDYHLEGWYKDISLTQKWDFENDTVDGNLTLYAKWVEAQPEIHVGEHEKTTMTIVMIAVLLLIILIAILLLLKKQKKKHKGKFCK